jgi:hypothetical protein
MFVEEYLTQDSTFVILSLSNLKLTVRVSLVTRNSQWKKDRKSASPSSRQSPGGLVVRVGCRKSFPFQFQCRSSDVAPQSTAKP